MSDGAIGKIHVTIPDLIDPVVAFRTMHLRQIVGTDVTVLVSPKRNGFIWQRDNEARCDLPVANSKFTPKGHAPPDKDCECGLYCYYDIPNSVGCFNDTLAIVTCWGVIEAHKTGMRVQYMRVEALCSENKEIKRLAEKLEVLFQWGSNPKHIQALANEIGSVMPMHMRAGE